MFECVLRLAEIRGTFLELCAINLGTLIQSGILDGGGGGNR